MTKMLQTSREGSAEGLGPETLSMSPFAGGAPGRSLKRLPSLQCPTSLLYLHCAEDSDSVSRYLFVFKLLFTSKLD